MKILFDQGTPVPLRAFLSAHEVATAYELGWSTLKNGELLGAAEKSNFECLVTTDKNLSYQQNLSHRKIALVILPTTSWPKLRLLTDRICEAVSQCKTKNFVEIAD
ncbi:MAG: hypothetical protein LBV28_01330 [Puniceicoccales bacterium]|jgi:predicted nuclease of predicted toxin-antitoxin system|nr:hypothetical protein [Puniceicoccales bacterium]